MDAEHIISQWLEQQPQNREIVCRRPLDEYPKLGCHYKGIAGGCVQFPKEAPLVEVLAIIARVAIMNPGCRSYIYLSGTKIIHAQQHTMYLQPELPKILIDDLILSFPKMTTKEELIKIAREIAAAWCPTAQAVWSQDDSVKLHERI